MLQTKGAVKLKKARWERRLSQAQAANLVGCVTRTILALELSQTTPRLELAYRIWQVFRIPMSAWVEPSEPDATKEEAA